MINQVAIKNFKCLRDVKVDLERFTVFVGPNASGKSSILQGLNLLCLAFRPANSTHPFVGGPSQFRTADLAQVVEAELSAAVSRGSKGPVEVSAEAGGSWFRYRTQSTSTPENPFQMGQQGLNGDGQTIAATPDANAWKPWKPEKNGGSSLPLSVLLRLEASNLVDPKPAAPDPTVMAPDGTGLHSALANMALNDPDSWQALQANLKQIIPSIRRLRHTKAAQMNQPTALLFDTVGADSLPASQVSEGTLLVLGLLAALHAAGRPNLVLFDDLDRGLHPKAQKELIALLRGLLDTNPDLQILATTHSPYMLDWMMTNEVRMTFLKDDGATVCAPLTSHPKYQKWKDEMAPGEMWSLFGEKWLVEPGVTA